MVCYLFLVFITHRAIRYRRVSLARKPYHPSQGIVGWLDPEEEPQEGHEVELAGEPAESIVDLEEEEPEGNDDDDTDVESNDINPPCKSRAPTYSVGPGDPMPPRAPDIWG